VRGAATVALGAAFAVPLLRNRKRIPAAVTAAALAGGPPALAVLRPRTRARDAALYALQMWAFTVAHELPYDDPEALRRRLRVTYPIEADRRIGGGRLPNVRLQKALAGLGRRNAVDRGLSWVHWLWFLEPHGSLAWILAKHPEHFARSARQMSAVYDIGCAIYMAVPTAPPWWASENGYTDEEVRRIMVEVGEKEWGRAWEFLYDSLGGNPWAAMPSLHFAASVMAALLLAETGPVEGVAGWAYAAALGFALVYLGEHYVLDLLVGAAIVVAVRKGEPLVDPVAQKLSRALQHLERIANP
jgi:membrane-associated phospholipid phosphatase